MSANAWSKRRTFVSGTLRIGDPVLSLRDKPKKLELVRRVA
jgi:hypothetical protein